MATIEIRASRAHDRGMESIAATAAGTLLDPVVLVSSAIVVVALLSGLAARLVDGCQRLLDR